MSGFITIPSQALEYLLEHGIVYVLKTTKRREGIAKLKTSKNGETIGIVYILLEGLVERMDGEYVVFHPSNPKKYMPLEKFVKHSGFSTLEEWLKAYAKGNGYVMAPPRLYKVQLVKIEKRKERKNS